MIKIALAKAANVECAVNGSDRKNDANFPRLQCLGAFRPPATSSCGGSRDPSVRERFRADTVAKVVLRKVSKIHDGEELEEVVRAMVCRLRATREGSAEHRIIVRQLIGIRDGSELGGLLIEDFELSGSLRWLP